MKKTLYILPLLALGLQFAACSSDEGSIFDKSAAERLEEGKKNYEAALTADGGRWALEYFANYDEPGYVFVLDFKPDNSVTFHADHIWLNNVYQSEKSLWEVINDDGNVLTFNSYNTLFHVFASPEDITGPNSPRDPATGDEINELGYGHNGDYEFMLMGEKDGYQRLRGKKRGLVARLTRLDADTDPEEYLGGIRALRTQFGGKFPVLKLTETATGAVYDVTGLSFGVPSIVPENSTSPASRTVSGNGIITYAGFRFMEPLEVVREDNSTWELAELTWADTDGALVSDGVRLAAPVAGVNLVDSRYSWLLDKETMSAALTAAHDAASQGLQAQAGNSFDLRNVVFGFNSNSGTISFSITTYAGRRLCRDFGTIEANADGTEVTIALTSANKASSDFDATVPAYTAFKQLLTGTFKVENAGAFKPETVKFTSLTNPDISFSVNVQ